MKSIICKTCKKSVEINNPRTNNIKYCSVSCRNKNYQPRVSEWQRARYDRNASKPAPNKLQCLICKKWYRKVGSHIKERHGITARKYREEFGLEVKRGLLTEYEREPLREKVFENGTINNLKIGKKFWFIKGDKKAGRYKRSQITLERLKKLHLLTKRNKLYDNRTNISKSSNG